MSEEYEILAEIFDRLKPVAGVVDLNELNLDLLDDVQSETVSTGLDALFENCDPNGKISRERLLVVRLRSI